ncbi:hypothetical protein PIB30_074801 [Stylosanthes scabra]|uniref:RRM domain-containing protein n=1 Tax=Stylosanthes scabra TaxID=79078 RepID=A0ABU6SPZ7_9FABA|nr:hypothetical protein [Stylosanthes scabra]
MTLRRPGYGRTRRVIDVYLSRKIRKANPLQFAFIRYKSREEARRTIDHLDGWIVWGCRLRLSISKYRREEKTKAEENKKTVTREKYKDAAINKVMDNDKEMERQRRSYMDILVNGPEEKGGRSGMGGEEMQTLGNSKIYLEGNNEKKAMMEKGLIGDTLNSYCFREMERKLKAEWQTLETVKILGDMKILMIFNSKENMEEAMGSEKMKSYFLDTRRWRPGEANRTRKFWLEITGLPIDGWSENMIKIGEVWGKVLKVEEEEGGHYSHFRVLVVANAGPLIRSWATIVIDRINYSIFVKENDERVSSMSNPDKMQGNTDHRKPGDNAETMANEPHGEDGERRDKDDRSKSEVEVHTQPEGGNAAVREAEAEESRVGETQQLQSGRLSDSPECVAETDLGIVGPDVENRDVDSPTKTVTLEDDQTTN